MTISAVIFDMDGLLLDTERVCLESFVATRRFFDLSDSTQTFLSCVGLNGDATNRIISDSLTDQISLNDFNREWDRHINASLNQKVPVKDGALQLVETLAAKGYSMAVATSTRTGKAARHLESSGLLEYFECVVGSDMVTKHKPDPEVYHRAAEQLGTHARHCIAFEDSEAGTWAAILSGAMTVQVPDLIAPSKEMTDLGHVIAPNLLDGAIKVGLLSPEEANP